uniref:Orf108 n=3 Tax=Brassica TaxID=3705 RepID=A0A1C9HJ68_9BRAS|nr:Orf108 [Brassica juncea x Brassica oxyrrhina]AOO86480.1 Orf108 [Brassica juncea x Brassica oxyrrhina]AXU98885.1 hypothetical protein [Brassica juncea]BBD20351.1 hypothetical protein [Brassica oxyrrhina]
MKTIKALSQDIEELKKNGNLFDVSDQFYNNALVSVTEALTGTVQHLLQHHNVVLPENWTHAQIVQDILGDDMTLGNVASVLSNITQLGLASDEFHQIFNIINLTGGGV